VLAGQALVIAPRAAFGKPCSCATRAPGLQFTALTCALTQAMLYNSRCTDALPNLFVCVCVYITVAAHCNYPI
jgi:hypothetical protein